MPIPAAPRGAVTPSAAVIALFHQLHDELRSLIHECDDDALNYVPCPGANSIATIIAHIVGSEAESLSSVAGVPTTRDRESEFRRRNQSAATLVQRLDTADRLLDDLAAEFTQQRLNAMISLPTLPADEGRPGITWLVGNLGHAREHVGHAYLTKQLHENL